MKVSFFWPLLISFSLMMVGCVQLNHAVVHGGQAIPGLARGVTPDQIENPIALMDALIAESNAVKRLSSEVWNNLSNWKTNPAPLANPSEIKTLLSAQLNTLIGSNNLAGFNNLFPFETFDKGVASIPNLPGLSYLTGKGKSLAANATPPVKTRAIPRTHGGDEEIKIIYSSSESFAVQMFANNALIKKLLAADAASLQNESIPSILMSTIDFGHGLKHSPIGLLNDLRRLQNDQSIQQLLTTNVFSLLQSKTNANAEVRVSLDGILIAYLNAYLNGHFVDRQGTQLSQPEIVSGKIAADSIIPFTTVGMEALYDYALMTPLLRDPEDTNTPTFAVLFPKLTEDVQADPEARGVTALELRTINFIVNLSAEQSKHLSSLLMRSLGGASVVAKLSLGDNDALSKATSTMITESSQRITGEMLYNFFEEFRYSTNQNNGTLFLNDADNASNSQKLSITPAEGQIVLAILQSQDYLKELLKSEK